jgi:hypothetical protein
LFGKVILSWLKPGLCARPVTGGVSSSCQGCATEVCDLAKRKDNFDCAVLITLLGCELLGPVEPLICKDAIESTAPDASCSVGKYLSMRSFTAGKQTHMIDRESSIIDKIAMP